MESERSLPWPQENTNTSNWKSVQIIKTRIKYFSVLSYLISIGALYFLIIF
jgi:hypothetical protein